jgi:quercetin dioxygenase-like cupin family protein
VVELGITSEAPHGRVAVIDPRTAHCPELPLIEPGSGEVRAIVWPGVGARLRSLHEFFLNPGAETVEQSHGGEAVYYVVDGHVEVHDLTTGEVHGLVPGSMIHIDPKTRYTFSTSQSARLVGGPCPVDFGLYQALTPSLRLDPKGDHVVY